MKAPRKKPAIKHSVSERLHKRRVKRKSGPSAIRRRERRAELQRKTPIEQPTE